MKKLIALACMASVLFASCEKIGGNDGNGSDPQEKPRFEKADINDYEVVEIKGYTFNDPYNHDKQLEITFDILDRNLGATAAYNAAASADANKAAIGDYYQFRNSVPVGTVEGLNKNFNPANDGKTDDWTKAGANPCPEGWRIPTKEELTILASAMEVADPYYGDQSDEDAALAEAFEARVKVARSGYWRIKVAEAENKAAETVETELYLPKASYFWGVDFGVDKEGQPIVNDNNVPCAVSLEYNLFPLATSRADISTARPIRCIR